MNQKKIVRSLAVVLALGGAYIAITESANANHSWGNYHWARTTSPFTLRLGDNLSSATWKAHLSQASSDWNSGNTPLLTSVIAGTSNKRCSMVAGTTQVCNSTYGNNGWLGLASINLTGADHITQGTAKMNDTYFNTATYNNPNEREHVMCQEVAHTFGLDHQSTDGSSLNTCMDYFSNTGANATSTLSTKPNKHDFDQLKLIYAHLDSFNTSFGTIAASSASMPVAEAAASAASLPRAHAAASAASLPFADAGASAASAPFAAVSASAASASAAHSASIDISDDPSSWGQLISQSKIGRSSYYMRHNNDGSQTLTHVYWTIEAASNCPSCDHRYERH
ncbi:MAG: hypothetical protein HY253_13180 [Burkholderiales bacterium]|nr:hypothetical protein [Burkholderiales bacterium]